MVSFSDLLVRPGSGTEPLAHLSYSQECRAKEFALRDFREEFNLGGKWENLLRAPMPRNYRATSKRRVHWNRKDLNLGDFLPSQLEPQSHGEIFQYLFDALGVSHRAPLAEFVQWMIVRGGDPPQCLILNVRRFDGALVRVAKKLGEQLQKQFPRLQSAFLYLDPSASDYYLEAQRPPDAMSWKRLFGPEWISLEVEGVQLRHPPTGFAQINTPMLPVLVQKAGELLGDLSGARLLDLYCGHGLFSCTLGQKSAEIWGADWQGPSIQAAVGNARHLGLPARFFAGEISSQWLQQRLPRNLRTEFMIVDPPRQGTAEGVVEVLARRCPQRVLQISCGMDAVPTEFARWQDAGFEAIRVLPLDLFPGTAGIELLVLWEPYK